MGYPKQMKFDEGQHVAAWELAARQGELRLPFKTQSAAAAFRYNMNAVRKRAKEAGHELAVFAAPFVLKVQEQEGRWWIVTKREEDSPDGVVLRTAAEQERDRKVQDEAAASGARLLEMLGMAGAGAGAGPGDPSEEEVRAGLAAGRSYPLPLLERLGLYKRAGTL